MYIKGRLQQHGLGGESADFVTARFAFTFATVLRQN